MAHITTSFGPFVLHKEQILQHKLHSPENSEVLAMLTYEGFTDKSISYLWDLETIVGFAYVEHFRATPRRIAYGTFGVFIRSDYRNKRFSYQLIEELKIMMTKKGLLGQPLEVSYKALPLIEKVFGLGYPLKEVLGSPE